MNRSFPAQHAGSDALNAAFICCVDLIDNLTEREERKSGGFDRHLMLRHLLPEILCFPLTRQHASTRADTRVYDYETI